MVFRVDYSNRSVRQNSLPSGSAITVKGPWPSSRVPSFVPPRKRIWFAAVSIPGTSMSKWMRFLMILHSGTRWSRSHVSDVNLPSLRYQPLSRVGERGRSTPATRVPLRDRNGGSFGAPVVARVTHYKKRNFLALTRLWSVCACDLRSQAQSLPLGAAFCGPGDARRSDVLDRFRHRERPVTGIEATVILLSIVIVMSQIVIALA